MKRIEVVAAVIKDGDRVFATQRGHGEFKDRWEFPGGKVEAGESLTQALVREIREELDADIKIGSLIRTVEWDYPDFHLTMHCYWCSLASSRIHLNEHESSAWLSVGDFRSVNWLPADKEIIPLIAEALAGRD